MLRAHQLGLRVGQRLLVQGLDWTINPGECWSLIGRNGAGKSTLLRALAGLREPDGGEILLDGQPLPAWQPLALARRRAFLSQGRQDAFGYRVMELVLAARHPYQAANYWESDADHSFALRSLQALDVAHLAGRDIRTLSGGERQRVAIAAVLAQDTPLLLLDEPTSALDLAHQMQVLRLLRRLCREEGRSVVLVGHDLNLLHDVASHALLLMEGGAWHGGTVDEAMTPALLGACLGHPVQALRHEGRVVFLPGGDVQE
nr:ABC transporter ATP-binding protein [Noviherbaspirillum humi]